MRQASKQAAPRAAGLMVRKETGLALTLGAFPEAEVLEVSKEVSQEVSKEVGQEVSK